MSLPTTVPAPSRRRHAGVAGWFAIPVALAGACQTDLGIAPKQEDVPIPSDSDLARVPDIELDPTRLDYDALADGCEAALPLRIRNVGDGPLEVTDVELWGTASDAFALDGLPELPRVIDAGGALELSVVWTSDTRDAVAASVAVHSNDPDEATVEAPLAGTLADPVQHEQLAVQPDPSPVDILWAIDWSGSMDTELDALADHIDGFIDDYVALGLDYRLAVTGATRRCGEPQGPWITSDMLASEASSEFVDQVLHVTPSYDCRSGSGTEEGGFGGVSSFVANYPDFVRPAANFAAVTVSDEPEQTFVLVRDFTSWLASLKGGAMDRVSFSAMVGPRIGIPPNACPLGAPTGASAWPAPQYHLAIDQTGGVWGNICFFDFEPFLRHLSYTAAGLFVEVALDHVPLDPAAIQVETLDGTPVPEDDQNGWTYAAGRNAVVLHGDALPAPADGVRITYPRAEACPL